MMRDETLSWRDYEYTTNLRLSKMRYFQIAVDPASITNATVAETTVTIRKVAVGDLVIAQPPASLDAGLIYGGCRVSAADTVKLSIGNIGAAPVDGGSKTWEFFVFALSVN